MGLFDPFDWNQNGKADADDFLWEEHYQKITDKNRKKKEGVLPVPAFPVKKEKSKYQWRKNCRDNEGTGVSPYDYETEEEYEEALEEAKHEWRDDYFSTELKTGVSSVDYETEEEYREAVEEAGFRWNEDGDDVESDN